MAVYNSTYGVTRAQKRCRKSGFLRFLNELTVTTNKNATMLSYTFSYRINVAFQVVFFPALL